MAVEQSLAQEFPLFTATVYGIRTSRSYASNVVMKILSCHVHSNQAVGQIYHAIYVTPSHVNMHIQPRFLLIGRNLGIFTILWHYL